MCFSVPYKVLKVMNNQVLLENGKIVGVGKELRVKKGEYLRIVGNIAVGVLTKSEGLKIRKLLKRLNN